MSYVELRSGFIKPRKKHRCEWCAEWVELKERCFYRVYIFEGEFNHGWMHCECKLMMEKTPHDDLIDGWNPGDFDRPKNLVVQP